MWLELCFAALLIALLLRHRADLLRCGQSLLAFVLQKLVVERFCARSAKPRVYVDGEGERSKANKMQLRAGLTPAHEQRAATHTRCIGSWCCQLLSSVRFCAMRRMPHPGFPPQPASDGQACGPGVGQGSRSGSTQRFFTKAAPAPPCCPHRWRGRQLGAEPASPGREWLGLHGLHDVCS